MKSYRSACFLLLFISCTACSYGQVWKQYTDSAKFFQEQKKFDKAIEIYSKAKEVLNKDSASTYTYATICYNLADIYSDIGKYEKAEPLFLEAKEIQEKVLGKQHLDFAKSCNNLAILYFYMMKYDKAESLYLESKQIREKVLGKEHPDYAISCSNLAVLYQNIGKYEEAQPLLLEVKQLREKVLGKEHRDYANSCINLAIFYFRLGQHDKAESLYLESKQIREKVLGREHPDYAASCNGLADLYSSMGNYEKAEPLCLEAKEIREKVLGKEHRDYANTCVNLGAIYWKMGNYEKAEMLFLEAKEIQEKRVGKGHLDYANSCNNLAALYSDIGQYKKAEPLFLEAKKIWEKILGKKHPNYALSCNNIASLNIEMGKYEAAELLFLEARQIFKKIFGKEHPDYAVSCLTLANLYSELRQFKKAEPLYLEAKGIQEKVVGKEHRDYASSCNNLGIVYLNMGKYEKAEPLFLESKQIWEKILGKNHTNYAESCNNLAKLYWLLHEPLQAEKKFEESFSVKSYNVSSVFQFLNEKEKEAYIKNIAGENGDAYSFFMSEKIKSGHPYSLSLFCRNLILSTSQALKKQIFSSGDTAIMNIYNEWLTLKNQLSVLYAKPLDERNNDAIEIEDKTGQLEKELTRLSSAFAKQQQRVDWKDIQNKLHADEASIEFASFRLTNGKRHTDTIIYAAFVLRKDSLLPTTTVLFAEKQLQDLLTSTEYKTTKAGVQRLYAPDGITVNNRSSKKSIYDLVWKPLEKELKGIKTIYFAPSGLLHRIAFSALPVNNKTVLSDRYKLIQLATTATVADQQRSYITDADKLQLYGGISYNADTTALKDVAVVYHHNKAINRSLPDDITRSGQWNELPGTNKEIESIVALSGTYKINITSYSGINATEENMKSLDGKASPAVLHIATHGFFFPDQKQEKKDKISFENGTAFKLSDDPLIRSGLLFAGANNAWRNKPVAGIDDGILTAYEVSNLYLPNTKLVVLSACETGLGDIKRNEGVYGLQRAFKIAGVDNLVMSLWKVSDLETAEFMEAFYKNMFAQQTISDAFYNAQNIMKDKYRQQPFKWAAWVLVR